MLIRKAQLKELLRLVLRQRLQQGCAIDEPAFLERIEATADSYDGLYGLALELREPPLRQDWPYREPVAWDEIVAESAQLNPAQPWPEPDLEQAAANVHAAFLGSVCGCMLGKPIEVNPSLAELQQAGEQVGEWPIRDYISGAFSAALGRQHESVDATLRENIRFVAADDDIHYTIIGMLLLENAGLAFRQEDIYQTWLMNIPPLWTWGPERSTLLATGINGHHLWPEQSLAESHDVLMLNPGDELCGALIRADAYGYACPGNPDLASWLAWKDASFTHIKTGAYGAMFIAALIALCHSADSALQGNERLAIVEEAMKRIPSNTRFSEVLRDALEKVAGAGDWLSGYAGIHGKYAEYSHCAVYQEIGTLINTLKFAQGIDHGFCLQVSQGNDTDSFGATAGSMLGCLYGQDHLDERWLKPFDNQILHALADFHEQKLDSVAERMSHLPARVYTQFQRKGLAAGQGF
ncbi:MAG: ADP-ribosylglycohydrolase family protein [Halieaceae bacterium]